MQLKGLALTLGLGAVAGAVAVLMMPRDNPARKLAAQAADKVEDAAMRVSAKVENAATRVSDMLSDHMGM